MQHQLGYFSWSITEGLNRALFEERRNADPESPTEVLKLIKRNTAKSLYALCDFHPYLHNQPEHVRLLKDIAMAYSRLGHTLILISHELELPAELKRFSAKFRSEERRNADPESPTEVLKLIKRNTAKSLYALCDFHPYLHNQPEHVRLLKDIAMAYSRLGHTLILISHELELPAELKRFSAKFSLSLPGDAQLMALIREEAQA